MIVKLLFYAALLVYFFGVFSGYYFQHPQAEGPDAYVHGILAFSGPIVLADGVRAWLKWRARR